MDICRELHLKKIRSESYLCSIADRSLQRLVGREKKMEVLVDESLPLKGVPFDYFAHISIRSKKLVDTRVTLAQFEKCLESAGYTCELFDSNFEDELVPVTGRV